MRCLGNLRFIAELGKLALVPEKILHDCVRDMSGRTRQSKSVVHSQSSLRKEETSSNMERKSKEETLATDMECLCIFLKVVGKYMDSPKAHNLMNQYFQRLVRIQTRAVEAASHGEKNLNGGTRQHSSGSNDGGEGSTRSAISQTTEAVVLPSRIRFMLDDLFELRRNGWVPQRTGQRSETNKPRYLRDIRMEIFKDSGTLVAPTPGERSASARDVPGSGYADHLSATSTEQLPANSTFLSGLTGSKSRGATTANSNGQPSAMEARNWLELARMGEELCRNRPSDLTALSAGFGHATNDRWHSSNGSANRPEGGYAQNSSKRFLNSKNGNSSVTNGNNNNNNPNFPANNNGNYGNASKSDVWNNRNHDRSEEDSGWTRGVAAPGRRPTAGATTAGNLPPRMLRKMATQGGVGTTAGQVELMSLHSESNPGLISSNAHPITRWGPSSNGSPVNKLIEENKNPANGSALFEPAYLHKEQPVIAKRNSARPANDQPVRTHLSPTAMGGQPIGRQTTGPELRPNLPSSRSNIGGGVSSSGMERSWSTAPILTHRNTLHTPLLHSDIPEHALEPKMPHSSNGRSTSDEQKKLSKRMLLLFEEAKTVEDLLTSFQATDLMGRLTTELLATFTLRACEEGATFPLSLLSAFDLAGTIARCIAFIGLDDSASVAEKNQSKSLADNPRRRVLLSSVWCHLLFKLLPSNAVTFIKSKFAALSAALLWTGELHLSDIADPLRGGRHHPMFLLVLQQVIRLAEDHHHLPDTNWDVVDQRDPKSLEAQCAYRELSVSARKSLVTNWFRESGVRMNQMMPDGSQLNDKLLEILEERKLTILVPSLRLSQELTNLVTESTCPFNDQRIATAISHSLETHANPEDRQSPEFIHAFMPAVYAYVYRTSLSDLPTAASPKELLSRERSAWRQLLPAGLTSTLCGSPERQLDALHALQLFWMSKNKPKGFLLRCFINMYAFDLVEENTFLTWKEELNPNYPAKGDALFEVNRWFTWLENAEEEDEDDNDDAQVPQQLQSASNRTSSAMMEASVKLAGDLLATTDFIPPIAPYTAADAMCEAQAVPI